MFKDYFTDFELAIAVNAAVFVAGVLFSTKIKDFFKGIPSDLRTALNGVEKTTIANVKQAQAKVVAALPQPALKPPAPPVPPAPVVTATGPTGTAA